MRLAHAVATGLIQEVGNNLLGRSADMTKLGRTVCGYVPHLLSNIQKDNKSLREKRVFSQALMLC